MSVTGLDACRELLRVIDPTHERPLYLVDHSAIDDDRFCGRDSWLAWTTPVLDLHLRSHLAQQQQWYGRGFATILRLDRIEQGFRFLAGAVLHEYGHYLDWMPIDIGNGTDNLDADQIRFLDTVLDVQSEGFRQPVPDGPRWRGHGARFVRACCHLAFRANHVFASIQPKHLSFIRPYHDLPLNELAFMASLEPELIDHRPIGEILSTTPPDKFSKLWELAEN